MLIWLRSLLYRKFNIEKARLEGIELANVSRNLRANLESLGEYMLYNLISLTLIVLMLIYLPQSARIALA
jgi:hypothetical protein